eukprot:TRINITY_DN42369_c0_g1_i4.p1 TRINITY_DN42369_c0_g1~~TRINITY_DN42369_c0_g1_i4.p1  ORF type:complete len:296 (+),score=28.81 TRINITY_DN42369_c0_g1_i4:34-921(+)
MANTATTNAEEADVSEQVGVAWVDAASWPQVRDMLLSGEKPAARVPIGLTVVDPWGTNLFRIHLGEKVRFAKVDRRLEKFDEISKGLGANAGSQSVDQHGLITFPLIRSTEVCMKSGKPADGTMQAATQKTLALTAVLQEIRGLFKTCSIRVLSRDPRSRCLPDTGLGSPSSVHGRLETTVSAIDCKLSPASKEYLRTHHEGSLLSLLVSCSPEFNIEADKFLRHSLPPDCCKTAASADLAFDRRGSRSFANLPAVAMANTLFCLPVATQGQISQSSRRLRELVLQEGEFFMSRA